MVLTTASCLDGAHKAEVHLGAHNLVAGDAEVVIVSEAYMGYFNIHWDWDEVTKQNDLAIIELPSKVPFSM